MPDKPRGFAAMDKEQQRAIASKGGKSVRDENRSFSKNRELAVEAGKIGGTRVPDKKRSFYTDRKLAAEAGKKGGQNSQKGKNKGVSNVAIKKAS